MGLSLESPLNFDGSTAYGKATRRDSPHPSSHSPFQALKAFRVKRRLSRQNSSNISARSPLSNPLTSYQTSTRVPAEESNLFRLPPHIREDIYSLVISPTSSKTLQILLRRDLLHKDFLQSLTRVSDGKRELQYLSFPSKSGGFYISTSTSIISLLLVSKKVQKEASAFIYSHYQFEFDHPLAIQRFCSTISPQASAHLKRISFRHHPSLVSCSNGRIHLPENLWRPTWQALGNVRSLESLSVSYSGQFQESPRNIEILDPRRYIPNCNGLTINVQAKWIMEVPIQPPSQSIWFKLPQSIREQIYDYVTSTYPQRPIRISRKRVLHKHDVCAFIGYTPTTHYCCPLSPSWRSPGYQTNPSASEFYYPILRQRKCLIQNLTLSKAIYHEASTRLYSKHEFIFDHPLAFIGFIGNLTPHSRASMKKVTIVFDDIYLMAMNLITTGGKSPKANLGINFDCWEECWRVLDDDMDGLKELTVIFETRWGELVEGSKPDPRQFLKKVERLDTFVVRTPWDK